MNHELGLQTRPRSTRPHVHESDEPRSAIPVLIEVPTIHPQTRRPRRPSRTATQRIRENVYRHGSSHAERPRRRLRREFRVAGYTMVALLPLLLAVLLLRGAPTSLAASRTRGPVTAAVRPPAISLSVEPSTPAARTRSKPPVVFHGYLLPDDDFEDPAHAGG